MKVKGHFQFFHLRYINIGYNASDSQAKRKKHDKRHDENVIRKHAAQILCEMLGQICHSRYYKNDNTEYQEVCYLF